MVRHDCVEFVARGTDRAVPRSDALVLRVIERLLDGDRSRAIDAIIADGGYNIAMAEWGLDAAATVFDRASVQQFASENGQQLKGSSVALSLAKSVATAPVRSIALPLLRGASAVSVRASRGQRAVARLVSELMVSEGLAVDFDESDRDGESWLNDVLNTGVSTVIAFGGDASVERARSMASERGARCEGHGHGMGAAWVDGVVSDDEVLQIAWDFCAYDGSGCLSPAALWVTGSTGEAVSLGARLARAMERWSAERPRGALSREWVAHERAWRAGAAAAAASFERGSGFSVAVFAQGEGAMVSPIGARNVIVRCAGETGDAAATWIEANARWLTVVACDARASERLKALNLLKFTGRTSALGEMQRPPLDGEADRRAASPEAKSQVQVTAGRE